MKVSSRLRAAGLGFASVLVLGVLPLAWGQEPSEKPAPKAGGPAAKRPADPARRVPDLFGQLGLTNEQRESIYKIRAKHLVKIEELRKQLAEANKTMLEECETVLTDSQKQLLDQREKIAREAAKARREARAKTNAKKDQGKPAN
jgi:hypothetical protein